MIDAVTGLDEIYRTAILMRYLDEKMPQQIARELQLPVRTVKTRLARGLERLRLRLDAEHGGDGRKWALVLAPFAGFRASSGPGSSGGADNGAGLESVRLPGAGIGAGLQAALIVFFAAGAMALTWWALRAPDTQPAPASPNAQNLSCAEAPGRAVADEARSAVDVRLFAGKQADGADAQLSSQSG